MGARQLEAPLMQRGVRGLQCLLPHHQASHPSRYVLADNDDDDGNDNDGNDDDDDDDTDDKDDDDCDDDRDD